MSENLIKVKNLTRPFYSTFLESTLIILHKAVEWKLTISGAKKNKSIEIKSLGMNSPVKITSNSKILAIQDDKNAVYFIDKNLSLVQKIKNNFTKSIIIKYIFELNSFVILDINKKKTYLVDLILNKLTKLHDLTFINLVFLDFKDFDFMENKYFFLNQTKAIVHVVDISNQKTKTFLEFGRGGYGYARNPSSILIINKDIFINDVHNYLIQKFDLNNKFINQIGGKGDKDFEFDLAYFSSFNSSSNTLICSDFNNDRVISIDLELKNFTSIVKGEYEDSFYRRPSSIVFDGKENIFIANRSSGNISMLNNKLKFITNLKLDKKLHRPACISILKKNSSSILAIIERSDSNRTILSLFSINKNSRCLSFLKKFENLKLSDSQDMVVLKNDYIYIADTLNRRILRIDINNESVKCVNLKKLSKNSKILIKTIAINNDDNLFTADFDLFKIYKFDADLNYKEEFDLSYLKNDHEVIRAIGFNKDKVFLCTRGAKQVIYFDSENDLLNQDKIKYLDDNWNHPVKIMSYNDIVYIVDKENDRIVAYNTNTRKTFYNRL